MTDTNQLSRFRETRAFDEMKTLLSNIDRQFRTEIQKYPQNYTYEEVSIIKSIDFSEIERRKSLGPDERVSYDFERPQVRINASAVFESDTGDNDEQNFKYVNGTVLFKQSGKSVGFSISKTGHVELQDYQLNYSKDYLDTI